VFKDEDSNLHQISLPLVNKNEDKTVFPLVINVISRFWGEEPPNLEIDTRAKSYSNYKGSILIEGLEIIEKRLNLSSVIYRGSISDLKKRLDQGLPVIVILPGIADTIQFATIVCGYDEEEKRIITYVPEPDSFGAIPEDKFIEEWKQDDFLTILIYPEDVKEILKNDVFSFYQSNRAALEAERLKIMGKTADAMSLIEKTLDQFTDANKNPQLLLMIAGILNEKDDPKCIDYYEKIIEINPKYYLAYRGLGNYFLKKGNYVTSNKHYLEAIKISPTRYGPIYKNLGLTYIQLGDNLSAKEAFKQYLDQVPEAKDRKSIIEFINS
jgi:tetratricopeptide (TPR) repeat protein